MLVNATQKQIPIIRQLAYIIWPETFKDILTPGQIDYMLDWMYDRSSLEQQMQSGYCFILFKHGRFGGYCSYKRHEEFTELSKLYLLPEIQGYGAGAMLLNEVISRSRTKGIHRVRLNVNRLNKAVGFYQKAGFQIIGVEDNPIGNGYFMNDYVMERVLE